MLCTCRPMQHDGRPLSQRPWDSLRAFAFIPRVMFSRAEYGIGAVGRRSCWMFSQSGIDVRRVILGRRDIVPFCKVKRRSNPSLSAVGRGVVLPQGSYWAGPGSRNHRRGVSPEAACGNPCYGLRAGLSAAPPEEASAVNRPNRHHELKPWPWKVYVSLQGLTTDSTGK